MAHLSMYSGSTVVFLNVYIRSTIVDGGLTGLGPMSPGLTAYYFIAGAGAPVQIPLAPMSLGTWVDGGFVEVDGVNCPGLYQFGLPNVAWSGRQVTVVLQGAVNMQEVAYEIELTATNNQDALRGGLLALPDGSMMFKKAQALNGFTFLMVNAVDGRTPMPGLTITSYVSKDGAAPVATDNTASEIVSPLFSGMYKINFTSADTNGNTLTYFFMSPGAQSTVIEIIPQP